jgi:hypothetical protein
MDHNGYFIGMLQVFTAVIILTNNGSVVICMLHVFTAVIILTNNVSVVIGMLQVFTAVMGDNCREYL